MEKEFTRQDMIEFASWHSEFDIDDTHLESYLEAKKEIVLSLREAALLDTAKELIELKYQVKIINIQFEDGSGRRYIITTTSNPLKKQYVRL